jgi:hypothetical protein
MDVARYCAGMDIGSDTVRVLVMNWQQKYVHLVILGLMASFPAVSIAQGIDPESLTSTPGVHITVQDGMRHQPAAHYEALCQVVLNEFGVHAEAITLNIVFIGEDLRNHLSRNNQTRFETKDWAAAFVHPSLILLVGELESDDTFMHEFMHYLHDRGLLFANVPESRVHATILRNEGLLLGSRSYLEYLKTAK